MTDSQQTPTNDNPFASPAYVPTDAQPIPSETVEEHDIRAFVGTKEDYYVQKWRSFASRGPSSAGFNWAAFFLAGIWLAYRKMYVPATIFYTILFIESVAEQVLFLVILEEDVPAGLDRIVGLVAAIVCGSYGNRWYLSHAGRIISEVRARQVDHASVFQILSERGGTSILASIGFFFAFLFALFVTFEVLNVLL